MNAAAQKLNTSAANIVTSDTNRDINVTEEIINVKAAKFAYSANAEMINTLQEMNGTLLDMMDDD